MATQSSLNKLGINVKLEKLANATMRDRVGKGDYDIAIGNWNSICRPVYAYKITGLVGQKGLPGDRLVL